MRRDWILIAAITAAAIAIRLYPAWDNVFAFGRVNFLETDAWYHVRLVENQVRNFPWRVTLDPYAAPGGQFVPIAPLYDTLTSAAVMLLHGRNADTSSVERLAAFIPPVLGAFSIITVWLLGRRLFDRRAGLLAAALLAILPGHFMDRTMLGFVDHHALEALLALVTLLALARAMSGPSAAAAQSAGEHGGRGAGIGVGVALGLYLLAWGSGAFLIAILGGWLLLLVPLVRSENELRHAARLLAVAALVALAFVLVFQDPGMHRYGSQVAGLIGLAGLACPIALLRRGTLTPLRKALVSLGIVATIAVAGLAMWSVRPELLSQIIVDVSRLAPDPARMGVLEARPLFQYTGEWSWMQPWKFFRTGIFVGLIALAAFTVEIWRHRRSIDVLIWTFSVTMFIATIGQNRFGYYLVPACALLGGWLASRLLDWGARPIAALATTWTTRIPLRRELAAVVVAGVMFAPNLAPSVLLMPRRGSLAEYWHEAMTWLLHETPAPFGAATGSGDDYYFGRYPRESVPRPDYSVMNWWDQGYWVIQRARRVPVANPTQARAPASSRFYAETDESRARMLLAAEGTRFVLADWELPFRKTPEGNIMGRFQSVVDWAGGRQSDYFEVMFRREPNSWTPVWIFHEPYYRSMAYRLTVLGGARVNPSNVSTVATIVERHDDNGFTFRELLSYTTYPTYEAARDASASSAGQTKIIVGLDPWRSAFPLEPLSLFAQRHAVYTSEQKSGEGPWVRIFEVTEALAALPPR